MKEAPARIIVGIFAGAVCFYARKSKFGEESSDDEAMTEDLKRVS
jgi:hypothetical protein